MEDERVARVVQNAMPDQRKPLARRASDHGVDRSAPDASSLPYVLARQLGHVLTDDRRIREIQLVGGGMNGVVFDCRRDIEARLLEAKRKAAGSGKEVDEDGPTVLEHHDAFGIRAL